VQCAEPKLTRRNGQGGVLRKFSLRCSDIQLCIPPGAQVSSGYRQLAVQVELKCDGEVEPRLASLHRNWIERRRSADGIKRR
jgi:hypothetical protein